MSGGDQIDQTRRFFEEAASGWTSRYERDAAVAARKALFLSAVQEKFSAPADILDFGCGSGDISLHLGAFGHRVTGYDLSEAMIAQARHKDGDERVRWFTPSHDGAPLPLPNVSFDAVVASSVLEYVPDVASTLAELSRVLRPGGWLFATVPDMRDPHRHRERWLRLAATTPGCAFLLDRSRWREGAAYLRISVNRMPPEVWLTRLREAGLTPGPAGSLSGPLLLVSARRPT